MLNVKNEKESLSLSLNSHDDEIMSKVQKEILQEDLNSLGFINENDINISTSYAFKIGDKIEVGVFFINGTLEEIRFDKICLDLLDENGNVVKSKNFNLREVGIIPSRSGRPWKIYFDNTVENNPNNKWKVVFKSDVQAIFTAKIQLEDLNNNQLNTEVELFMNNLPQIQLGEISIHNYKSTLKDDNSIKVDVLVRNATNKKIKIDELPITVWDSNNKKMFSIMLNINNLEVSSLRAKLYSLIINFDKEKFQQYNLENIHVDFIKE